MIYNKPYDNKLTDYYHRAYYISLKNPEPLLIYDSGLNILSRCSYLT